MRLKTSTLLTSAIVLLFAFSSCNKIKESLERDVILTPAGVELTIPIITGTDAALELGQVSVPLNIDEAINKQASQFGVKNLRNVKITGFKIDLLTPNPATAENSLGNLETLNAEILANGTKATLASVPSNSSAISASLSIPANVSAGELKDYLTASDIKYKLSGKLRKATTVEMRVKITATYTLTVGL